ncbi:interferon-induced very large GTPase 1-like isoform X2 [Erinaceus europaeus]|uniref:Interferon-induced very large GTPase 1-like isoform X2 n=1 Tax=Erinaceus europaeus TaxID=9365 RepID=A0ABM3W8Q0_ERIEU|nr:interferon-induced very large GTPase 1-like isoform X2 [Erinaceus europaeus]
MIKKKRRRKQSTKAIVKLVPKVGGTSGPSARDKSLSVLVAFHSPKKKLLWKQVSAEQLKTEVWSSRDRLSTQIYYPDTSSAVSIPVQRYPSLIMATVENDQEVLISSKPRPNLQEMLRDVGLAVEYWLPKLQEHLGVTCAEAIQYLGKKDLQKLKTQAQYPWEEKALEKLLKQSHLSTLSPLKESPMEMIKKAQKKAEKFLQKLRSQLSEGRNREEESVRENEAELRQAMDIPKDYWPSPEKSLKEVTEIMQRQLNFMEDTLSQRQNLPDKELIRLASGGLALQGIFKTSSQKSLLEKREELLRVPEKFSFFGPEQGTQMETKEFTSSQQKSIFTKTIEKLGFSAIAGTKGGGWGCSLEAGMDRSKHSESSEIGQSHAQHSYYCATTLCYVPVVSCHFLADQLQLSNAAFQKLKQIEELISETSDADSVKYSIEDFFQRFGSHANQGPLHLGGIYWWKAISEGFQSEQLEEVKQLSAEALDSYIKGSYAGLGINVAAEVDVSNSQSKAHSHSFHLRNHQTKVQLSAAQTGGPPEASDILQWKAGLVASNKTWCVIDQELQLVPVWDIILSNHRSEFKDPLKVADCLKDAYTALTGLTAMIHRGKDLLNADEEARAFLEEVKSWQVSDPGKQLNQMVNFMQMLSKKMKSYQTWINIYLTDSRLQNFLINTVNYCKVSPTHNTALIKSQLRSLLDPHIYEVTSFPKARSILKWIFHKESQQEQLNICQFSELIKILKKNQNNIMDVKAKSESLEIMEEAQKEATSVISLALDCFLSHLQEQEQSDIHFLLLSIAAAVGFHKVYYTFQHLLEYHELGFLVHEMQSAHDKYQELKSICSNRAQAFLVLTSLTVTAGVTAVAPEEKNERLEFIKKHIGQLLSSEVMHVLTSHGIGHDWENLEKDLRLLTDGNYEVSVSSVKIEEAAKLLKSIFHERKRPQELHNTEENKDQVLQNGIFLGLLQYLGLESYYPKRMKRKNFQLIYKTSVFNSQPRSGHELPFYYLQKLQMLDYSLRYLVISDDNNKGNQVYPTPSTHENETFDPFEDLSENSDTDSDLSASTLRPHIHPMDIQMAILHCADDFARQYILGKLSICQYALPLLIPNPCNSQIEFSLWSLRQVRKNWQQASKLSNEKYNYTNQQMCRVSAPVVSFIRVGNGFSASKSQIMNCLLSKRKHDVFFHRHCKGSTRDCVLMGGVVEICWFCPGGDEEDKFDKCVAFTNLHGDAKVYKQQLNFLLEISSIIVLLMSTSGDDKENRKFIQELSKSSPKSIVFLIDDREKVVNTAEKRVSIGIRNRNEAELTEELTMAIRRLLELSDTTLSLEDCARVARSQGFIIDEDHTECKEAKEKADTLVALLRDVSKSHVKQQVLPLQGLLWHSWCKKDKELYHLKEKGNRSIEQHKCLIEAEKQRIRKQQLITAFPLNDFMRSVLEVLQNYAESHNKHYFLQWLSVFLDDLTARHLEKLKEKKNTLCTLVQTEKKKTSKSKNLKLREKEIEAISMEITGCTLGIEHILREISQIYEGLEEASSIEYNLLLHLPEIAADLMISGVPIELMDGEAAYVPLKWVAAVFDKVSEKLGNKRLFVLSVLGLQSSGKSTLLNALFGLQFTVSAGRCTQGAYMQLLKVEETFTEELGFDFLLVVDTEGLRAPELSSKSQNRDNELATFVIGLGNLTLINIFGENPSEMQDILQIVVQAFLRMKQVKISPSCLFVHQNVGEVTAKEQTMEGRRRLEQRLDEMAATAAEQEQYSDITRFSDVIKFDVSTQVFYFAHLWDGNPPMAPPNPRYSHNIQELKSNILTTAKETSRGSIMKISDVKLRVQDLWRALVSENFIFSFRNTQEVMAMSKLETRYNSWTWELRRHVLDLHNQQINEIQNGKLTESTFESSVTEKHEAIKKEFEKYFSENPDYEILVQWKANFEMKLLTLKEALISDSQRKARELISFKRSQEKLESKKTGYEKEILKRSQDLASTVKGKELSEEELYKTFNQLWQTWVYDVTSALQPAPEPTIDKDAENVLLQYFQKEKNMANTIRKYSGEKFQIIYDKHAKLNKYFFEITKQLEAQDKESINVTTDRIVSSFNETINNILGQKCDYNSSYFHEIYNIVEKEVQSASTGDRYTFTNSYKIDLSLSLFQRASEKFKEMHEAFKRANDPKYYLESKKNYFFMSFKISCQGATSVKVFIDFLWQKLTPAVSTMIEEKTASNIAGDMRATCPAFNGNRSNLEKHILISLAEEENFENYQQYIFNPKSFFSNYIRNLIRRYFSGTGSERMKTFLKLNLEDIKTVLSHAIEQSTTETKDKSCTVSGWLDFFCNHLGSNLIFPRKDLIGIEHQEINDIEFLKKTMFEALDPAMDEVSQNCLSIDTEITVQKVEKMLSEHLSGCWKQCPFCRAICTNTIPNHDGDHSVPFHRPEGINGIKWIDTDNFSIDFCTSSVASDCYFVFDDGRKFPYKNYRLAGGEYATWSITPDISTQPYWKWFVCHFRSQLENTHHKKFQGRGQIPDAWNKITKQDAIADLKKQ